MNLSRYSDQNFYKHKHYKVLTVKNNFLGKIYPLILKVTFGKSRKCPTCSFHETWVVKNIRSNSVHYFSLVEVEFISFNFTLEVLHPEALTTFIVPHQLALFLKTLNKYIKKELLSYLLCCEDTFPIICVCVRVHVCVCVCIYTHTKSSLNVVDRSWKLRLYVR